MQHMTAFIESMEQLDDFLNQTEIKEAGNTASSILVQLFLGVSDSQQAHHLTRIIHRMQPRAVIVAVNSAGEIANGRVHLSATVISMTFFQQSSIQADIQQCRPGKEYGTGRQIAANLEEIEHLKGVLLLAPPTLINCATLLEGIQDGHPMVPLFGGGSAGSGDPHEASLFLNGEAVMRGAIILSFAGKNLHIDNHLFFSWKSTGLSLTLTRVDDFRIHTIDDKPAFDIYRDYLNIEPGVDKDIFLLEFPLLIERDGLMLARNPIFSSEDGSVSMVADVYTGETAHLGYLDVDENVSRLKDVLESLNTFTPEAIFIYSCICRRFTLQQDTEMEIAPFQALAPVAGFFTYGEFCRIGDRLELLNSSQIIVSMREGEPPPHTLRRNPELDAQLDQVHFRHMRVTSRLFQLIGKLTQELQAANESLLYQAEHDPLTGAYNRIVMDQALSREMARSQRHRHPFSLVMVDIDHFKQLNDRHGHDLGDRVLKDFTRTLQRHMRSNDILFRYGGEEFLLLLPETDLAGAVRVAEKFRQAIEAVTLNPESKDQLTASFGVSSYPRHGNNLKTLIKSADHALYIAKSDGRNRVRAAMDQ